jgi:hypothetical protein
MSLRRRAGNNYACARALIQTAQTALSRAEKLRNRSLRYSATDDLQQFVAQRSYEPSLKL